MISCPETGRERELSAKKSRLAARSAASFFSVSEAFLASDHVASTFSLSPSLIFFCWNVSSMQVASFHAVFDRVPFPFKVGSVLNTFLIKSRRRKGRPSSSLLLIGVAETCREHWLEGALREREKRSTRARFHALLTLVSSRTRPASRNDPSLARFTSPLLHSRATLSVPRPSLASNNLLLHFPQGPERDKRDCSNPELVWILCEFALRRDCVWAAETTGRRTRNWNNRDPEFQVSCAI